MEPQQNLLLLNAIREENRTQGSVARAIGETETTVTRFIRGYKRPSERQIEKLCKELNRSRAELGFEPTKAEGGLA